MKIAVCVKWAGALGDDIEFDDAGSSVDQDYLDYALSDWDSCAAAEALRIREESVAGSQVVAITVGGDEAEEALVQCLAMGADRAIRIDAADYEAVDAISIARLLASAIAGEAPDLVLCGVQSSDASQGATGTALAALLGLPVATVVTKIDLDPSAARAVVRRELEGGVVEVLELQMPAVMTIQTGAIEPRYVTLRAIQQAKQVPIDVIDPVPELTQAGYGIRAMLVPPRKQALMVEGGARAAAETIKRLVTEARA